MNFFKKSPSSDSISDDKWKNKYLSLLDDYEASQKNAQTEQDLLKKTIIRLAGATKGLDPYLDPHIIQIHKQLKSELNSEQLHAALKEFSDAVLQSDSPTPKKSGPSEAEVDILIDILNQLFPEQKEPLSEVYSKKQRHDFQNTADFVSAILKITQPIPSLTQKTPIDTDRLMTIEQIVSYLSPFLNTLEIPLSFKDRAQTLNAKFHSTTTIDNLKSVITLYKNLVFEINQHVQLEQKEMASFLSSLPEQLTELGLKASGAFDSVKTSSQNRTLLDESVTTQMSDLQKSSAEATTLDSLKNIIKTRLMNIRTEIQEHAKNEAKQRIEREIQLNELKLKLNTLDAESTELKTKLTAAYENATRDTLTNLPNRLAYEETTRIEIARWQRYKTPLTLAIWDIDLFKTINDTHGHKAGDKTLIIISQLLSKHSRQTDFVARLGGEEFIMLLPNTTEQSALSFTNKIRLVIERTGFNAGGTKINITISCGLSEFREGDTSDSVFERADQALYQSKANGRNQCIIAQ